MNIKYSTLRSILVLAYILMAGMASALPITSSSGADLHVAPPSTLHVEISGPSSILQNYTIGLYDLSSMTAERGDPDFQVQALQADRAIVLQEYGKGGNTGVFDLKLGKPAEVGIFLLRNATLRDFSLGLNPYKPIFSTDGAPGSNLFNEFEASTDQSVFTLQLFQAAGQRGGVMTAGPLAFEPSFGGITISLTTNIEAGYIGDQDPRPIVPEPATLMLVGLGLSAAGMIHRRRAHRA